MNARKPNRDFVENLLSRDEEVAATNFEEFRMNLEQKISRIQHRSRMIRRWSFVGVGVFCAICAIIFFIQVQDLILERLDLVGYEWIYFALGTSGIMAFLATGMLAALNQYKYLPAIKRARFDLQTAMIEDLQRQVAELTRRLDERSR